MSDVAQCCASHKPLLRFYDIQREKTDDLSFFSGELERTCHCLHLYTEWFHSNASNNEVQPSVAGQLPSMKQSESREKVVDRDPSRRIRIPEELTGMYILECASQPHLWGMHSASLASLLPLADILLIDKWKKYLAPVHKSQGAGMASSAHEPMAGGEMPPSQAGLQSNKTHQWGVSQKFFNSPTVEGGCWRSIGWLQTLLS